MDEYRFEVVLDHDGQDVRIGFRSLMTAQGLYAKTLLKAQDDPLIFSLHLIDLETGTTLAEWERP